MLESLGLGEAATPEEADVLVFNTCTIREKPDTKLAAYLGDAAARKRRRPGHRGRRRRLLRGGAARADLRALPVRRRRVRPGLDPASRRVDRAPAGTACRAAASARTSTSPATLPMHRERRFQAWVQVSMGCNSTCAYCIVPAVRGREQSRRPGEIVAEVEALAARRRQGDHAARPERQLVGPRPRAGHPHGVRRAAARLRRGRRDRAHPLHEPAPEGLPRARDRRDRRVRRRCASTCTCRCSRARRASSRRCAGRTRASATCALVDAAARRDPRSRARDRHHRRLPGRDRGGLRSRRSRSSRRSGTTAPSRSSTRRARGPRRQRWPTRCPTSVKRERMERLVDVVQRVAAERNARARRPRRGGARRGPEPHGSDACSAAGRAGTRRSTSPATAAAGRARRRPDRGRDVDDAAGPRGALVAA